MHTDYSLHSIEKTPELEAFLQGKEDRLGRHLAHFGDDLIHLHLNLSRSPHTSEFVVHASVYLPSITILAHSRAKDLFVSINAVFRSLQRQTERHKDRLRHRRLKRERY